MTQAPSAARLLSSRRGSEIAIVRVILVLYGATAVIVAGRMYSGGEGAPALWPLLAITATLVLFIVVLLARGAHLLELGIVFAGMTALYGAYPLLSYAVNGFSLSERSESRLFETGAQAHQIGLIGWWYELLLFSFCIAYLVARGRRTAPVVLTHEADTPLIVTLLLATAVTFAATQAFGRAYSIGSAESYSATYLLPGRMPLLARQVFSQVNGFALTLQIFLIVALFTRYRQTRWLILTVIALMVVLHVARPGARTQLFLLAVAASQLYSYLVRPIRLRWLASAALAGFVTFSLLAGLRARSDVERSLVEILTAPNEFDIIFANAYDLLYVQGSAGAFLSRPNLYWVELVAFIPQQLLPMVKDSAANWYVRTFYPSFFEAGGGLAFGAVAEAIVGLGVIELFWRGTVLGLLFGFAHRRLAAGRVGLPGFTFYVWLSVWAFQAIRNTTFCLITLTVYRFMTPFVIVWGIAMLMRRAPLRAVDANASEALPAE